MCVGWLFAVPAPWNWDTPQGNGQVWRSKRGRHSCGARWQINGKPAYAVDGFPQKAVSAWMNSTGHRANILNPDFTHTGIGIWAIPRDNKGYMYTTQVFIKR
jgi:hypothetical protein